MISLPDELHYLRLVLTELSALPSEKLNEDVDLTSLEAALRDRVKGLSIRDATRQIKNDCEALKQWTKQSGESGAAASFVIGSLSYRTGPLARRLLAPVESEPPGPTIAFEPPNGWSAKPVPLGLHLRAGRKKMGAITIIDNSSLELMAHQNLIRDEKQSQVRIRNPFAIVGEWTKSPVRLGEAHGHKYLYKQTQPAPWKSIQYLLKVPGGAVNIMLDMSGEAFDEIPFESNLHTLRLEREAQAS